MATAQEITPNRFQQDSKLLQLTKGNHPRLNAGGLPKIST